MGTASREERGRSRWRRTSLFVITLALVTGVATPLFALEARVAEIRAPAASVRAVVNLKDAFAPSFRKLVEEGGTLYLRIEAELWEDRAAWDRLIAPRAAATFRIVKGTPAGSVTVHDPAGVVTSYPAYPVTFPVGVDVAPANRIDDDRKYYLRAIATVGTSEGREIDDVGNVIFGSERESGGLTSIGKYVFRKALEITDYLQSASSDTTSRKWTGKEIKGK